MNESTTALFDLMARQHGVAATRQARALGVTRNVEARLIREGALSPLSRDVVIAGGLPRSFAAMAMAASLTRGVAAVSHGAAARLHGFTEFARYPAIDVLGGKGTHLRLRPPVLTHFTRGPIADDVTTVANIPVTSIPLTIVLVAADRSVDQVRVALDEALVRGISAAQLRTCAERWRGHGRRGPRLIIDLLADRQSIISSAADQGSRRPATTASIKPDHRASPHTSRAR